MFTKRTLLALSISMSQVPSMEALAEISQYNYDTQLTNKQVGVDIQAVINCGAEYGNNKECETASTDTAKAGYGQNSNVVGGSNDVRSLNKGNTLNIPPSTSKQIGYSSIDQVGNANYGETRDIAAQQQLLSETYGSSSSSASQSDLKGLGVNSLDSTGVNTKDTSTNLTSTYNTNKLSNAQGEALRYKCLEPNPKRPVGSRPTDDSYYLYNDVQCLSVRTVSLSNDNAATSGFSKSDPLRDYVTKSSTTNKNTNNKVINVNTNASNTTTANQQSYACELTPENKEYSTSTCQSTAVGRQQVCQQKLTIMCEAGATGDRVLPECMAGLDRTSIKVSSTDRPVTGFNVTDSNITFSEAWSDGGSTNVWTMTFMVNNPDKVNMTLLNVHYDNRMVLDFNGVQIFDAQTRSKASQTLNMDLKPRIRLGMNTLKVTVVNWSGPAAGRFNIYVDPSSYKACECKESWVKTCSIENAELQ